MFDAVPTELKAAIAVGIGAFIAMIGLVDAGFVRRLPDAGYAVPAAATGRARAVHPLMWVWVRRLLRGGPVALAVRVTQDTAAPVLIYRRRLG